MANSTSKDVVILCALITVRGASGARETGTKAISDPYLCIGSKICRAVHQIPDDAGGVGYNEKDEMALSTFLSTDGRSVVPIDIPGFDDARKGITDAKSSQF
jgi:hypothetical protein